MNADPSSLDGADAVPPGRAAVPGGLDGARPSGYSFCLITHGRRPEKLRREIESIRALGIPAYEILVGGEVPPGLGADVRVVLCAELAKAGRLGALRNRVVAQARYDHVIVADDDLWFAPSFYAGLRAFGEDYDVQCVRLLNPDGSRFWDWATVGGPRGHCLLDYGETDPFVYVTGGLCIMKAHVAEQVRWDERLGFYEGEDAEFSQRLRAAGFAIRFNPHCCVIHDDARYTQVGRQVFRLEHLLESARDNYGAGNRALGRALLGRAVRLQGDDAQVWRQAAIVAARAGDWRASRQFLRRAGGWDGADAVPPSGRAVGGVGGAPSPAARPVLGNDLWPPAPARRREGRFEWFDEDLLAPTATAARGGEAAQRAAPQSGAGFQPAGGDEAAQRAALHATAEFMDKLAWALQELGPFYAHVGGAGDALLLLATFLDREPEAQVVSLPNSLPAARAFFEAFPTLRRVVFLPPTHDSQRHRLIRQLFCRLPNCLGAGVTPEDDHDAVWTPDLDIFTRYGVARQPEWVQQFQTRFQPRQVALGPKGSLSGMVGSKRNVLPPEWWQPLLHIVRQAGFQPVILGTPEERADYPCLEGCADARSHAFRPQMEIIANSALFIGADSWGKTFAALAGRPALVFAPIRGADWSGRADASDFVFLHPWESVVVVKNLEEFAETFSKLTAQVQAGWEGRRPRRPSPRRPSRRGRRPSRPIRVLYDGSMLAAPCPAAPRAAEAWWATERLAVAALQTDSLNVELAPGPHAWLLPSEEWFPHSPRLAQARLATKPTTAWLLRRWRATKARLDSQGAKRWRDRVVLELLRFCRKRLLAAAQRRLKRHLARAHLWHLPLGAPWPEQAEKWPPAVFRVVNNPGPLWASGCFGSGPRAVVAPEQRRERQARLWFITHSAAVKASLCAQVPELAPARVHVVSLFADDRFRPLPADRRPAALLERLGILNEPYFVCRGGPMERAVWRQLLAAYAQFVRQRPSQAPWLVMLDAERQSLEWQLSEPEVDPVLHRYVVWGGGVDRADWPGLYAGALAVIYLSPAEGLGLPLLEAMQCGVPALALHRPYAAELAGEAALWVKTSEAEELSRALARLDQEASLRQSLARAGLERAGQFSVRRCAAELQAAYAAALEFR